MNYQQNSSSRTPVSRAGYPVDRTFGAWIHRILLFIFYLGFYTRVYLDVGVDSVIWCYPSGIAASVLIVLNLHRPVFRKTFVLFSALVCFIYLFCIEVGHGLRFTFPKASFGLFCYALFTAWGGAVGLLRLRASEIEKFLRFTCVFIVIGGALEQISPLRSVSDAFRAQAYARGHYSADDRDIAEHGGIRPKLFTQEPSHLAYVFVTTLTAGYLLARSKKRDLIYGLLAVFGLIVIRSPVNTLVFATLPIIYFFYIENSRLNKRQIRGILIFGAVLLIGSGVLIQVLSQRISSIMNREGGSNVSRVYVPLSVCSAVLVERPIFGAGLTPTGTIFLENQIRLAVHDSGLSYMLNHKDPNAFVKNAFLFHWINFGLIGGAVIWCIIRQIGYAAGGTKKAYVLAVIVSVLANGTSAYISPQLWITVFGLFALSALSDAIEAPIAS